MTRVEMALTLPSHDGTASRAVPHARVSIRETTAACNAWLPVA
jgi:hypothetical protein